MPFNWQHLLDLFAVKPMMGVWFEVSNISVCGTAMSYGKQVSLFRDAFMRSFLLRPTRLFLAMYSCEILVAPEIFGRVCGQINKRHGKIIKEVFDEEMNTFTVSGQFPIIEEVDLPMIYGQKHLACGSTAPIRWISSNVS